MMQKPLTEMSLEELWTLFPIVLKPYRSEYPHWYETQRQALVQLFGLQNIVEISHIGSTAIPGCLGKPIIDILLQLQDSISSDEIIEKLEQAGWLMMSSSSEPYFQLSFNLGYTPNGFAERVYHLHVRRAGDWDELIFRDALRADPEAVDAYVRLKQKLSGPYRNNRDGYTDAKTDFVRRITAEARQRIQEKAKLE